MRSWKLALVVGVLLTAGPALADDAAPAATPDSGAAAAADPAPPGQGAEPAAAAEAAEPAARPEAPAAGEAPEVAEVAPPEPEAAEPAETAPELGPVGYDAEGRPGRVHVVRRGDTLWDIAAAYLETPWVWPSIWRSNREIANPHRIHPGDRIWISAHEMRLVSEEEAEELLANAPADEEGGPASLDTDAMPDWGEDGHDVYRVPSIHTAGFVTEDALSGEASIVDSPVNRTWLQDHDPVVIGLGAGEVEVGDKLSVFRPGERVTDPDTGRLYGYATQELGWMEVTEVREDGATGVIRLSRSEMKRGDHVRPLRPREPEVDVGPELDVAGRVLHTPDSRRYMGTTDFVYLDQGTRGGLAVGSPLEVYRPVGVKRDRVADRDVPVPDQVVAKLLVVEAHEDTAVAVVTHTTEDVIRGDHFRGTEDLTW